MGEDLLAFRIKCVFCRAVDVNEGPPWELEMRGQSPVQPAQKHSWIGIYASMGMPVLSLQAKHGPSCLQIEFRTISREGSGGGWWRP